MNKMLRLLAIILFLCMLVQCSKEPDIQRSIIIQVMDSVVTITEGTQADWSGVYVATDESGHDLTDLVSRSVNDTTGLGIGVHEVVLNLEKDGLSVERRISLNVILTEEDIIFDVPDVIPVFQMGGTVSVEDLGVTARTESGRDLSDRIEMVGYNLDHVQTGFHVVTFRIQKTATTYEEVEVPFEVRNGDDRIEIIDILTNVNILHDEVHGNLVYILGFHRVGEDVYDDLIVFDMEDGSVRKIEKWAGNLHGTEPWPHVNWTGFTIHDDMIHIVGSRVDMVDETADGTEKYSYETMVDVYDLDLVKSHSYDLPGAKFDMPTGIAINASGEIAVTGYGIKKGSFSQTALFSYDHVLITTFGGNMKTLIAAGDAFVAAGGTSGYTSQYVDGYAFMFDSEGMVWNHTERGFDYDTFTRVERTDEGLILFGETGSHQYPDVHHIAFVVRMDLSGNVLGRVYYPEAPFAFPSLAHVQEGTWMVSYDVVGYPDGWDNDAWTEHRIPRALLYDAEGNLLESHTIFIERYLMSESSIVLAYGDALYVITSLFYHAKDLEDVGDPLNGLFIVRIHRGDA